MIGARAAIAFLLAVAPAAAQTPPPQPIVRATLAPAQVVVGQPATLVVEVLAPNYMTKPPIISSVQIANAITRAGSTININDRQGDTTFAGIRYEFLIFPQEAGIYSVPAQTVTVTFADDPPHTVQAQASAPAMTFEATIPDAASGLNPFVSATRLTLRQDIRQSSQALKIGDAVTRIVTIEADGAPAMLLPPTKLKPIEGAQIYPGEPELNDQLDQRSGVLTATRVDRATYILEASGALTLPTLEISWWDVKSQQIEHTRIDAQTFTVAAGSPASRISPKQGGLSGPRRLVLFVLEHWFAFLSAIVALALLAWAGPPILQELNNRLRQRRALYTQSELCAFRRLRRSAKRNDARSTYRELVVWALRIEPGASSGAIKALTRRVEDSTLAREITALEQQLFAPTSPPPNWSGAPLIKAVRSARSTMARKGRGTNSAHALPDGVNPERAIVEPSRLSRPVAR